MKSTFTTVIRGVAACIVCLAVASSHGATIIKLDLADTKPPGFPADPDISMNDSGVLSTANDGDISTPGDQNTRIEIQDFLTAVVGDTLFEEASFTLSGLAKNPAAPSVNGTIVTQTFTGGTFSLYNASNFLILSGTLNSSALVGTIGPAMSGTGALFTTSFGTVTGGSTSIRNQIATDSLSLSISLTNINGGNGFSVSAGTLVAFTAGATINIAAPRAVPEPTTAILLASSTVIWLRSSPQRIYSREIGISHSLSHSAAG